MTKHVFARRAAKARKVPAVKPKPFRYKFPSKLEPMLKESRTIVSRLMD